MKNQKIMFAAIIFGLGCFALLPQTQAVSPTPDGCYSNFTTAEGCDALSVLTTGIANTAVGWSSLFSNTDGSYNTAMGAGTLLFNIGDQSTSAGVENTAVGAAALLLNVDGSFNTATGSGALVYNTSGGRNVATGIGTLQGNTTGWFNTAAGNSALNYNTTGFYNTAVGDRALEFITAGDHNTALGAKAGSDPDIGSNNIYIGDPGFAGDNNVISIGGIAASGTPYTDTFIGGIYDTVVTDRIVYIAADGHLGTLASSRRYKEEIKPMDKTSEALFALQPVTFRYKQQIDPSHKLSFGLIAEEVAKVSPDLISRDKEGKPQTVRYEAVNTMLLNEFLKEHKKTQNLESRLAQQAKEIESLKAGLQKVSAQIEMGKSAPQVVVNEQ